MVTAHAVCAVLHKNINQTYEKLTNKFLFRASASYLESDWLLLNFW